jgi:hypothetical protein
MLKECTCIVMGGEIETEEKDGERERDGGSREYISNMKGIR